MDVHEEISKVAYELYEKSGCAEGQELENWLEAERMILERPHAEDNWAEIPKEGETNPASLKLKLGCP